MKIKKVEYFEFDELSKDVKQTVIDKWYELENYPFLCEDIENELNELDKYFSNVKLCYSLSYSQGDGLSFEGDFDLEKWLNANKPNMKNSVKLGLNEYIYSVFSKSNNGHYCYCSKNDVDYTENYQCAKEFKHIDKLFQDIFSDIQEYYINLCNELEKYGYSVIDYRMNIDEFLEHCQSNEYNFLECGKMVNY